MKKIFIVLGLLGVVAASGAFAVPYDFVLVSPVKVSQRPDIKKKLMRVRVVVEIPCSNDDVLDWASTVSSSDDEGDLRIAVGVVIPATSCKKGDLKKYTMTTYEDVGLDDGVEFVPMKVKNENKLN